MANHKMTRSLQLFVLLALAYLPMPSAHAATIPFFNPYPKINSKLWYISNGWVDGNYDACEWLSSAISANQNNLKITLSNKGGALRPYGCGEIHTISLSGYGTYETEMKTAAGSGLNSNFFTYIGPGVGVATHDEIDFEFLGKNPKTVQLNYWTNGVSAGGATINLGFDASQDFHHYAFVWAPKSITWYIDGKQVFQTKATAKIPTTPGRIYLSLWAGAASMNSWLGPFTYTAPVSAEYQWVKFTPLPQ